LAWDSILLPEDNFSLPKPFGYHKNVGKEFLGGKCQQGIQIMSAAQRDSDNNVITKK
jgi:hypothetical protein